MSCLSDIRIVIVVSPLLYMKRDRDMLNQNSILQYVQEDIKQKSDIDKSTFLKCAFSTLLRERDFGSRQNAILDSMYRIPISCLSLDELNEHKSCLTMMPTDTGFSKEDNSFEAFECDDMWFSVPKYYGLHHWGQPCHDKSAKGKEISDDIVFKGKLKEDQLHAVTMCINALNKPGCCTGGMLVLPCGYGKTVVSLYVAFKMKIRTLVLVHKSFLVQQWQERVATFLPTASIGKIQRDTIDFDCDFVIGMIQSISTRDYPEETFKSFGLVIIDEAHHMSAPIFSKSLRKLAASKTLALSATPERKDGLTDLLYWSMGDIIYRVERKPEYLEVYMMIYNGGRKREHIRRDGKLCLPKMISEISEDNARNRIISEIIQKLFLLERHIILLTDRISQLKDITTILVEIGIPANQIAFYIGTTPAAEREIAAERKIILSTYSMAKEGLDIPSLDTLILATPKGDIEQSVGRIQRPSSCKKTPMVIDIVDPFSLFNQLRWKRGRHYKKMNYEVKTVMCNDEELILS